MLGPGEAKSAPDAPALKIQGSGLGFPTRDYESAVTERH